MDNKMIKEAIETIVEYSSSHECLNCILYKICMAHWKRCPEYWNIDFVEYKENA